MIFRAGNERQGPADELRDERQLRARLALERAVSAVSSSFVRVSKPDDAIDGSLAEIGRLRGASRAYVFRLNHDGSLLDNTHEWCAEGVSPQRENLQGVPSKNVPWWMERLHRGEVIRIADVSRLPAEARVERERLESQDIKSLLVLPLYLGQGLAGFVGFDNVMETGDWTEDDIALLRVFSEILGCALEREQAEKALAERVAIASLVADVSMALSSGEPLQRMLQRCAEVTVQHLEAAFVRIWLLNEADNILKLHASAGIYTHLDGEHGRINVGERKVGLIARDHHPILTNAVIGDPHISDQEWARREGMVAFAGHPLILENRLVGVLAVFSRKPLGEITSKALASVAGILALGVERRRSEEKRRKLEWESASQLQAKNEELARALADAREATELKSRFLAHMSHEIRTPMNSVLGLTDLLLDTALEDDQKTCAEAIKDSAQWLLGILNDILDLSKIEAGKLEIDSKVFEVTATVNAVIQMLTPRVGAKDLKLTCRFEPNGPQYLVGDPVRFRQVLTNLVGNAVKFTDRGQVDVLVEFGQSEDKMELRCTVRDTGIGIPQRLLPRIFDSFVQADSSATRRHGGAGLGLAISKQLAEAMGGEIGCESEEGCGTTFWFTLSMDRVKETASAAGEGNQLDATVPNGDGRSRRGRILVAEDDAVSRTMALRILQKKGFEVHAVANGRDAVEALAQSRYDLVFMDVQMPNHDGLSASREIREMERGGRHTPIVAMTASAMRGDRERCLESGMDDYISKPMSVDDIRGALHRWLGSQQE